MIAYMNNYIINIVDRMQNISYIIDDDFVKDNDNFEGFYCDDNIIILLDGYIIMEGRHVKFNEIIDSFLNFSNTNNFIEKFNINISGDFCLCIVLKKESKVLLFRDPMGHKVCYFYLEKESLYLTNDSTLLYSLITEKKADLSYIYKYLSYQTPGYMEYTRLPIQNCYRCLAGHYLLFELDFQNHISYIQKRYFNVNDININYEATQEDTKRIFKEAVYTSFENSKFLLSHDALVSVSGGLDSTLICSVLQDLGLKNNVNYFSYSIWDDENGFSEDKYLKILENEFDIKINRFYLYDKVPSLFRYDKWNEIIEGEPGSISSISNMNTIALKTFELNSNKIVFGYVESLFRNVNDYIVKFKEFTNLPAFIKLKHHKHYTQKHRYEINLKLLNSFAENCCDNTISKIYDDNNIASSQLHDIYINSSTNSLHSKLNASSIQEIKYENILSPNYECLANFRYALNGINSITPLHNTNLLKFAISTPSFQFYGDPKYYIKNINNLPKDIIYRPKISASTNHIFKSSILLAAKYMNESLHIEQCINMQNFRDLCQRIVCGTFTGSDFRRFFSIISLEKFITTFSIKIDL